MTQNISIEELPMPIVYIQHLAREFPGREQLLAGTGLQISDLDCAIGTITVREDLQCVANAMALAMTPDWYHEWGTRIAEHFHGPLTTAWLSAPSLGEGLNAFSNHFPRRIPYMHIESYLSSDHLVLEFRPLLDVGRLLPLLIEIPMLILQRYINTIRNGRIRDAAIELNYAAPSYRDSYLRAFDCPVRFDCRQNRLLVPVSWLDIPNLGFDEAVWHATRKKCEEADVKGAPRQTLRNVRSELFAAFDKVAKDAMSPTLEGVARNLHMSPRTVIRRLRAIGTTFHSELDDVRKVRARELLSNGLRVFDVATALKYNDPTNFGKAFRRWFGLSPGQFKAERNNPGTQVLTDFEA